MGRTESKQVTDASLAAQRQQQQQANSSFDASNRGAANYEAERKAFVASNPYGEGGTYSRDLNTRIGTAINANQGALAGQLADQKQRTGENSAGVAATLAESHRAGAREATDAMAQADADRASKDTAYKAQGLQLGQFSPELQARMYGTATGGQGESLRSGAEAAKTPGFWDVFAPALAAGAGQAAGGFAAKGCWIAEAIYGIDDPRTLMMRLWLNTEFIKTRTGAAVMWVYLRVGKAVAHTARRSAAIRAVLTPLFNAGLRRAAAHYSTRACETPWPTLSRRRG